MMTRRERLMATLRGDPVDRPAVNFYEVGGFKVNTSNTDEFNIYNDPSWKSLLRFAEEETDLILLRNPSLGPTSTDCYEEFFKTEMTMEGRSQMTRTTLRIAGRTLTSLTRRDPEISTCWHIEHLLKDLDDARAYLQLPDEVFVAEPDIANLVAADEAVGEAGIVMVDTGDPLCDAASLFSMADFTIVAMTEQKLFHQLIEKASRYIYDQTEKVAKAFPGHLWRIVGPEYATEPYLPPHLFEEYVVPYAKPIVESIQRYGGYARMHVHGRIRSALKYIASLNPDALEPIEPPPYGDVELADVRREYGENIVLIGNLEARDIEILEPDEFEKVVAASLRDGTAGKGRGFILMPSSCPCGRTITPRARANYETMVRLATNWSL